jgi:hypothetical protein
MSDISLAVGDGARRMTYAELAAVRGTTQASAQRLVRRKHWPRQTGNDGIVRVLVPLDEARTRPAILGGHEVMSAPGQSPRTSADNRTADSLSPGPSDGQSAPDDPRTVRALESAVEELRATIADLRRRLDHESERANCAQSRIDELHTDLADAVTAERIAAGEAAALRAIVTRLRARPWWRRWLS